MKVFVQSLLRRKDRVENIKQQLAKAGIVDYIIIPSIDAKEYAIKSHKVINHFANKTMPNGYVGNHATRSVAFGMIKQIFPDEEILYLEDDLVFVDNFIEKLEIAKQEVPIDWDCLNVGCWDVNGKKSEKINQFVYKPNYPVHSHCILYSPGGISKISSILQTFTNTFDIQTIQHLSKINYYATYNLLAKQDSKFGSDGNK